MICLHLNQWVFACHDDRRLFDLIQTKAGLNHALTSLPFFVDRLFWSGFWNHLAIRERPLTAQVH
jgi:hypothetical protein